MKNRWILFLLFTAFFLSAEGKKEKPVTVQEGPVYGELSYIEGQVSINGSAAVLGMHISTGDTIATEEDSYCEVVFLGKNIFQVQESTFLVLSLEVNNASIELQQGSIGALFDKLESLAGTNPFEIKTPTTTAGIRGTAFFIAVEDQNNSYICACNGAVYTESIEGDQGQLLESGHHKAIRFTLKDGKITHESAAMLYHDDDSMDAIAAKIDSRIPWTNDQGYSY